MTVSEGRGPGFGPRADDAPAKLGAFGGVFTPSLLTILGIIFYLRVGYVVGEVGLLDVMIIVTISYAISLLTSLSLSAIATSMEVKGGGFYYVISRTLGFEFGGALGLALFVSISIGIAFYAIGLGEVVAGIAAVPDYATPRRIAAAVIVLFFALAWAGADIATKLQYVVMAVVVASIGAIAWGGVGGFDATRLEASLGGLYSSEGGAMGFWPAFALFFPAITGFTQGLNMSGDLRDARRDIPLGTLSAVILSYVLYMGLAVIIAGNASLEDLRNNYLILEAIAPVAWIVTAGVIAATASSAIASFLGAPRILQALGRDRVFPYSERFAAGSGASDNPRRAVVVSGAIALAAVGIGDLNFLAPIITMFFLASYGLLNYATYFVARAASPNFRPTFGLFHKYLSLAGALGCVAAMIAINPVAAAVAVVAMIAIHQYLGKREDRSVWADSQRSYDFQVMREQLFKTTESPGYNQDWRPQILIFSKGEEQRKELLVFAELVEANTGITTLVVIIDREDGDTRNPVAVRQRLRRVIDEAGVEAFPLVVEANNFRSAFAILLQSYGVGPVKANTVLLNWSEQLPPRREQMADRDYGRSLNVATRRDTNVVILSADAEGMEKVLAIPLQNRRIDIWWSGDDTANLMLLFAYLVTRSPDWEEAQPRILAEGSADRPERTRGKIEAMLDEARIYADIVLLERIDTETVVEQSADAAMVFIPGNVREEHFHTRFDLDGDRIAEALPVVAFCIAGEEIELSPDPDEVDPSEG